MEVDLSRIYVALLMTREVARRGALTEETSRSMLTLVNVATSLIEEILDDDVSATHLVSKPEQVELIM